MTAGAAELFDVLEDVDAADEFDDGVVGWKLSLLPPKPRFDANRPPTEIVSVLFCAVITRWPPAFK